MKEFEEAKDKVMMGTERQSMVMTEDEKRMTAYHEAGHAIVAFNEPASDPIHKATIIPRGRALGMVMRLPERDNYSYHRDKMYANLAVSMGGRVAEEVIFGYDKVSSGASSDISYATGLARDMVTRWGMSDALGPLQYAEADEEVFLGYSVNRQKNMSNETAQAIDKEIRRIVEQGYDRAKICSKEHRDELETLAKALLEYETLSGDEIKTVLDGGTIDRGGASRPSIPAAGSSIPKARRKPQGLGGPAAARRLTKHAERHQQDDEQADRDEGENGQRDRPPQRPETAELIGTLQLPVHVKWRHQEKQATRSPMRPPRPAGRRRSPGSS